MHAAALQLRGEKKEGGGVLDAQKHCGNRAGRGMIQHRLACCAAGTPYIRVSASHMGQILLIAMYILHGHGISLLRLTRSVAGPPKRQ